MMRSCKAGFVAGAVLAGSIAAFAADGTSSQTRSGKAGTNAATATAGAITASGARADDRIASEFSVFAGSRDNAHGLVAGLRRGTEVALTAFASAGKGQAGTSTTFTPPTPPMDSDNVRIGLALAQEQLIRLGITRPTAEQIKAALAGGAVTNGAGSTATTTRLQGVLQMRAQGMGWGQVASAMGTKLGHVMGGLKQTNEQLATGRPVPGAGSAGSADVTTAAGTGRVTSSARGYGRGAQAQVHGETGAGVVVTAAGSPAATSVRFQADSDGSGVGVAMGADMAAGSRTSATGQASGEGHANP